MPTAADPALAAAITDLAGHRANVSKWVAAGILAPTGGSPGTGHAYPWTADDVRDAEAARALLDLGLEKRQVAQALASWRDGGRPSGYLGATSAEQRRRAEFWPTAAAVQQALRDHGAVLAVPTP